MKTRTPTCPECHKTLREYESTKGFTQRFRRKCRGCARVWLLAVSFRLDADDWIETVAITEAR